MRIPYSLLKLLPMWDYVCPKCKKEVKQKSHKCLYCGEDYGVPLRVPPKVLKDPKVLEDYVHKYIFPKVSASQREYLARFFTEIFSDGFESGDFSAWTGTTTTSGYGTIAVNTARPKSGTYACDAEITSQAAWTDAFVYKTLGSSYPTLYTRVYVNVDSISGAYYFRGFIYHRGSAGVMQTYLGLTVDRYLQIVYRSSGALSIATSTTQLALDTWYCVELKNVVSSTSGEVHVYLNGVEVNDLTKTGLNNSDAGSINHIDVGVHDGSAINVKLYIDCVVVADAYIGPEVAPPTPKGTIAIHAKLAGVI